MLVRTVGRLTIPLTNVFSIHDSQRVIGRLSILAVSQCFSETRGHHNLPGFLRLALAQVQPSGSGDEAEPLAWRRPMKPRYKGSNAVWPTNAYISYHLFAGYTMLATLENVANNLVLRRLTA